MIDGIFAIAAGSETNGCRKMARYKNRAEPPARGIGSQSSASSYIQAVLYENNKPPQNDKGESPLDDGGAR